jgi:peptidoglycan-associated lipoprotein
MKKQVILSITMLASLAGCGGSQKKPKTVAQHVDLFTAADIPLVASSDRIGDDADQEVFGFFDEDLGEFTFADEATDVAMRDAREADSHQLVGSTEINWTDLEQAEQDLQKVYFEFNKYGVKPDQRAIVTADAEQLKELVADLEEDTIILVEGHACHSAGSSSYNLALSEKRAKYVRDLLVAQGINPEYIRIVGRGQEIPAMLDGKPVSGDRTAQWPNRRVEIRLVDVA